MLGLARARADVLDLVAGDGHVLDQLGRPIMFFVVCNTSTLLRGMTMIHSTNLGPCCGCETLFNVRNTIMLDTQCAVPGRGWGCLICSLPANGAVVVLCDDCLDRYKKGLPLNQMAMAKCRGNPAADGREAFDEYYGQHKHDIAKHQSQTT